MRPNTSKSQVHVAPYVMDMLKDICISLSPKYTSKSQVHIAYYVLGGLKNTCNLISLKNILHLMFLVD